MLWYNNVLSSKCENNKIIMTPNHIKNHYNITNQSNLSTISYEDLLIKNLSEIWKKTVKAN